VHNTPAGHIYPPVARTFQRKICCSLPRIETNKSIVSVHTCSDRGPESVIYDHKMTGQVTEAISCADFRAFGYSLDIAEDTRKGAESDSRTHMSIAHVIEPLEQVLEKTYLSLIVGAKSA